MAAKSKAKAFPPVEQPFRGRRIGTCCIDLWQGCVLLGWNKARAGWELPGGKQEGNETVLSAIIREVVEETGLILTAGGTSYLGYLEHEDARGPWLNMIFFAEAESRRAPALVLSPSHLAWHWFPLHALPQPLTSVCNEVFTLPAVVAKLQGKDYQTIVGNMPQSARPAPALNDNAEHVAAKLIAYGALFRRPAGTHWYRRISTDGVKQIGGKSCTFWKVYGVNENGTVTVMNPDDMVVPWTRP